VRRLALPALVSACQWLAAAALLVPRLHDPWAVTGLGLLAARELFLLADRYRSGR
jgi:hypothetical protein